MELIVTPEKQEEGDEEADKSDSATSPHPHKQTVINPCCSQDSEDLGHCDTDSSPNLNERLSSHGDDSQSQVQQSSFTNDSDQQQAATPFYRLSDEHSLDEQNSTESGLDNSNNIKLNRTDCYNKNELANDIELNLNNNHLLQQQENSTLTSFTNTTLTRSSPRICRANKQDLKGAHRERTSSSTGPKQQQKAKENIKQGLLFVKDIILRRPTFCVDDLQVSVGSNRSREICDGFDSTKRRRSLSEGDLFLPLSCISTEEHHDNFVADRRKVGGGNSQSFSEGFGRRQRRQSSSCSDISLFYESRTRDCEAEYDGYEEESEYCEADISESEEINEVEDKRNFVKKRGSESPRIRLARRRKNRNKQSFIAKSVSVDPHPENNRYFSNIRNRRNGIVKPVEESSKLNEDDFIADLIEFNRQHKKPKKGLRLAKSVENFFDKSLLHHHQHIVKDDLLHKTSKDPIHRFFAGLFTKHEKMDYLRETNILDSETTDFVSSRPDISVVGNSIKKVAGVIELYIDSQGDVIRKLEIVKIPGHSLGFFIRYGNGIDRTDGIFISRVTLGSFVDENNLLHSGDEILEVNKVRNLFFITLELR